MNTIPARNIPIMGGAFTETIADGVTGSALRMPAKLATVTFLGGSNTGKIQYTTSLDAAVEADTAIWTDSDEGEATGTFSTVFSGAITALRCVSVSGEVSWEVVI